MYCAKCGQKLIDGTTFCTQCGTPAGQTEILGLLPEQPQPGGGKAVGSLVCGIISVLSCGILFPLAIAGLIFGILGLKSTRTGMAIAGICLNAVSCALLLFVAPMLALLLPAMQAARSSAMRMQCAHYEQQIGIALHVYHEVNGAFPPLYTVDDDGKPLHSWRVLILPYIEHDHLYRQIRLDEPWDSDYNRQFHGRTPPVFWHPGNRDRGCRYSAIAGGAFVPATEAGSVLGLRLKDLANASETLALVEVEKTFCWMDPTADVTLDDFVQNGMDDCHRGGGNGVFVDGTCQWISRTASPAELRRMATPRKVEE